MDGHYKILFPIGCRSDAGLVAPIIRRLNKDPKFKAYECHLMPMNFAVSYQIADEMIKIIKPDLFFANADRVEMMAATCAAFLNKIRIVHYQAGVVNDPVTTYDDIFRHCITLMSDVQLCENADAYYRVIDLLTSTNRSVNVDEVGITHLDDLEIDESKVYGGMFYDLILYNTPTMEEWHQDINSIEEMIAGNYSILVSGNPDGEAEMQLAQAVDEFHIDLPRPQFFGLLKNCTRFITNSSCAITEAPYFLKPEQIIMVGNRNRNRPKVDCKPGGSDNIYKILKDLQQGKK